MDSGRPLNLIEAANIKNDLRRLFPANWGEIIELRTGKYSATGRLVYNPLNESGFSELARSGLSNRLNKTDGAIYDIKTGETENTEGLVHFTIRLEFNEIVRAAISQSRAEQAVAASK